MRLNDAIMKGCQIAPIKISDRWHDSNNNEACTLGAAILGIRSKEENSKWMLINTRIILKEFPELRSKHFGCPEPACNLRALLFDNFVSLISHLTAHRGWSREAIANWLDPRPELHVGMSKEVEELVTV